MIVRDHRHHPRARVDVEAEVHVRTPRSRRVPATIRTASARGLGLLIRDADADAVLRGRTVSVHFTLDNDPVHLPAKVAWRAPQPDGDGRAGAGVAVHLEIAGSAVRASYRRWIEQLLGANRP